MPLEYVDVTKISGDETSILSSQLCWLLPLNDTATIACDVTGELVLEGDMATNRPLFAGDVTFVDLTTPDGATISVVQNRGGLQGVAAVVRVEDAGADGVRLVSPSGVVRYVTEAFADVQSSLLPAP